MDKTVVPILLSLLFGTVLSVSLEDTELRDDLSFATGDRINEARERVLKLLTSVIADDSSEGAFNDEEGGETYSDVNIPLFERYLAANAGDDAIDQGEATALFLKSLSNNGRAVDAKRSELLDCLTESCEEMERRRQPNRNAHYRTLPFGKRVQRQTYSTVRNTRKSAVKNKNKSRGRQPLLPFGK